uniref:40S ribosomal protein S19 n=1 Tax=Oxyrrhis marina TaxID=2969 RepID=A7WQG7_OXYMA|nr:40S ribosomal protein S19 [Oxyrrhis marina]|mmetsp:Transcript_29444/g.70597  ORF Transcript_29444/g.70597 Transcript_29444/m.70597 type:complete len:163 (-) Transcript_29444:53-541(-)
MGDEEATTFTGDWLADVVPKKVYGVKDVMPGDFVIAFAQHLKRQGKMEMPKWVDYAKTGHFKQLAPLDPDWLYHRAASLARQLYVKNGKGVLHFRRIYGGKQRRGHIPNKRATASGKIIRYCMQQLESMGLVEACPDGGRRVTPQGMRELDVVARKVSEGSS